VAETFRCGHSRTPENLAPNGKGFICRTCKQARVRAAYTSTLASRSAPELVGAGQRGCNVADCQGVHLARGLCRGHYSERKRQGDFGVAPTQAACSEVDCSRPALARSFCKRHYTRARRAGLPRAQDVNAGAECAESGCAEPSHAKGLCRQHFNYWRAVERYGIDRVGYERLVQIHSNRCAICGTDSPGAGYDRWSIDHDHGCCPGSESCGRCVRGLLCRNCNVGLGHFNDDPDRLLAAAAYVLSRANVLRAVGGERPSRRR